MPRGNEYLIDVVCPVCEEKFSMNKYNLKRRGNSYCRRCASAQKFIEMIGTKINRLEILKFGEPKERRDGTTSSTFVCKCECGKEITALANSVKSGHTKSCGCYLSDVKSAAWSGSNNPQFSKLSFEERTENEKIKLIRRSVEYQKWREEVVSRDFGECQKCGTDMYIEVHHIQSFKHNPELALDPDNGITLCSSCHKDYHSFNGGTRKEATIESFEAWYEV